MERYFVVAQYFVGEPIFSEKKTPFKGESLVDAFGRNEVSSRDWMLASRFHVL